MPLDAASDQNHHAPPPARTSATTAAIPPERLLRALLLQAFYSVRSERLLMEQLDDNLLYRGFVGLGIDDPVWHPTAFTTTRDRLLAGDLRPRLITAVGWGLNWPVMKLLLREWPPLSARGAAGVTAALPLPLLAVPRGEGLAVPVRPAGRLLAATGLNVTAWMGLATLSLPGGAARLHDADLDHEPGRSWASGRPSRASWRWPWASRG